ncbi:hypothetical protein F5Y18DRAFT_421477 [Xylariaceae sp. FL1019]|nr:hypothetical protein F5Y18DRAFT_421477 [Xylariaceae sp. FL1019]
MAPVSTSPPGQYEWLVVVPDKPRVHEKRLEVRSKHLAGTASHVESGKFKTGGALLNEKPDSDDATKFSFYGSTLTLVASSREEVIELLSRDIYATSGVWDMDKVQVWALKAAFRNP